MAEASIELPPDSTGKSILLVEGDNSNFIPTGIYEEVVQITDAQGFQLGDKRMFPLTVTETTAAEILLTLQRILLTMAIAYNIDPASAQDAQAASEHGVV